MTWLDTINDCCEFAVAASDGVYGWVGEAASIVFVIFVFNFLAKWVIKRLHAHYERQKKIWTDSFFQALYKPLSYYAWFFAAIETLDIISKRISVSFPVYNRHILFSAGAVIAFTWFLLRWKGFIVKHMIAKSHRHEISIDRGKIGAIDKLLTVAIIFFSMLTMLEATGSSINTLIAFGGIGGLALAFASQEIIANFFGGFMIYLTQPFTVGDWILIPDHQIEGYVEDIGWYMTRVRSMDKRPVYIPNAIFSKLIVITPSRMSHRQIKENIGLRYEDISKTKEIIGDINEMLHKHKEIDHSQSIIVNLDNFGAYSLDIHVRAHTLITDTEKFMEVKEDILFKIAAIVTKHGAEMACPTQNITITDRLKPLAKHV